MFSIIFIHGKTLEIFFWRGGLEVEGPCLTISLLSIHYQLGGFQDDPTRQLSVDEVSTARSSVWSLEPFHFMAEVQKELTHECPVCV